MRRCRGECAGVYIERTGPNVAIDDSDRLVGKPKQQFSPKDLLKVSLYWEK